MHALRRVASGPPHPCYKVKINDWTCKEKNEKFKTATRRKMALIWLLGWRLKIFCSLLICLLPPAFLLLDMDSGPYDVKSYQKRVQILAMSQFFWNCLLSFQLHVLTLHLFPIALGVISIMEMECRQIQKKSVINASTLLFNRLVYA